MPRPSTPSSAWARALGPALAADHIAVNALCPGFADTAINEDVEASLLS